MAGYANLGFILFSLFINSSESIAALRLTPSLFRGYHPPVFVRLTKRCEKLYGGIGHGLFILGFT